MPCAKPLRCSNPVLAARQGLDAAPVAQSDDVRMRLRGRARLALQVQVPRLRCANVRGRLGLSGPGLPPHDYGSDPHVFPHPIPGAEFHEFSIEDELRVPSDLPPGEYVLGWRWDCEMSSQVWNSCADISIV